MSFAATGTFLAANASWIVPTIAGIGTTALGVASANNQAQATKDAAQTQAGAAQAGINAQQQQFDEIQKLLAPYVGAGTGALAGQQDLLGLNGNDAQQNAINGIQSSPMFTSMQQQGNNAILANAAATGGLRGGNTQGALAQFSPQLLNQLINQRFSNLGSLSSLGQNAASGVGNAGSNSANQIASLLQQQGAATAGGQLAQGNQLNNYLNAGMNGLGAAGYLSSLFKTPTGTNNGAT